MSTPSTSNIEGHHLHQQQQQASLSSHSVSLPSPLTAAPTYTLSTPTQSPAPTSLPPTKSLLGRSSRQTARCTPVILQPTGFRIDQFNGALIIVDPLSTGAVLANEAYCRGIPIICVFAAVYPPHIQQMTPRGYQHQFIATIHHTGEHSNVDDVVEQIKGLEVPIRGCLAGCETGVQVADALSAALSCLNNNPIHSSLRRNKHLMQQRIKEVGLRSIKEVKASRWEEVEEFVESMQFNEQNPFQLILKPIQSAASDGVSLCRSLAELQSKFNLLLLSNNILGQVNDCVVVQEYLHGKEYIVDCVSYNGVHKVTGVWEYDKRMKNGNPFVYYGIRLLSANSELGQQLASYERQVLDALYIQHGPSHGEVIMTNDGPCLVEVGARCQGGDGSFVDVIRPCQGYDQVSVSVDIYDQPEAFQRIPMNSSLNGPHGAEVYFVSSVSGKWVGLRNMSQIENLQSFVAVEWYIDFGSHLDVSTNWCEIPGSVKLIHASAEQLEKDMAEFHRWNEEGVFIVEPVLQTSDKQSTQQSQNMLSNQRERK